MQRRKAEKRKVKAKGSVDSEVFFRRTFIKFYNSTVMICDTVVDMVPRIILNINRAL